MRKDNAARLLDPQPVVSPTELPTPLTRSQFEDLALYSSDPCISIFLDLSMHTGDTNPHQPRIRFQQLLKEAEGMLRQRDMQEDEISMFLSPARSLIKNEIFWLNMEDGIAFFLSREVFYTLKMKIAPKEDRVLDSTFYVAPLLPLMKEDIYFYILVISKKKCKLFRANNHAITELDIDLPEDVNSFRDEESRGRAGDNLDEKTNLAVYFEYVDDILWKEVLNRESAPLILAGVEYLIPIYKSVCDYKNVWPESLTGSREQQDQKLLLHDALFLVSSLFDEKLQKAIQEFGNKSTTELTSVVAANIIAASYYSRVSHLFVRKGEHLFGKFNEQENQLELNHDPDEGGEDLLDNAIVNTLSKGGEVFLLDREQMPQDSMVAAIFRY